MMLQACHQGIMALPACLHTSLRMPTRSMWSTVVSHCFPLPHAAAPQEEERKYLETREKRLHYMRGILTGRHWLEGEDPFEGLRPSDIDKFLDMYKDKLNPDDPFEVGVNPGGTVSGACSLMASVDDAVWMQRCMDWAG